MSAAVRSPSAATPGLTLSLYPPPWRATEVIMEMRQPFGPPWRLLLVRDDCGSVVAMVPIYSAALLRASFEADYARALPDAQARAALIASAPVLLARVARLEEAVYNLLEGAGWLHEDRTDYAPWIKAARSALSGEEGR